MCIVIWLITYPHLQSSRSVQLVTTFLCPLFLHFDVSGFLRSNSLADSPLTEWKLESCDCISDGLFCEEIVGNYTRFCDVQCCVEGDLQMFDDCDYSKFLKKLLLDNHNLRNYACRRNIHRVGRFRTLLVQPRDQFRWTTANTVLWSRLLCGARAKSDCPLQLHRLAQHIFKQDFCWYLFPSIIDVEYSCWFEGPCECDIATNVSTQMNIRYCDSGCCDPELLNETVPCTFDGESPINHSLLSYRIIIIINWCIVNASVTY